MHEPKGKEAEGAWQLLLAAPLHVKTIKHLRRCPCDPLLSSLCAAAAVAASSTSFSLLPIPPAPSPSLSPSPLLYPLLWQLGAAFAEAQTMMQGARETQTELRFLVAISGIRFPKFHDMSSDSSSRNSSNNNKHDNALWQL